MEQSNMRKCFLPWIDTEKIRWRMLSGYIKIDAFHLFEENPNKIYWQHLSINPNVIHLLEANPNKIDWYYLSMNPTFI